MTNEDVDIPRAFADPCGLTHPDRPLIDDDSATVIGDAIVELTLLRSPAALGDGLADIHAMVSLLAQLHAWLPIAVASARAQDHTWAAIAGQLQVSPATARRRYRTEDERPRPVATGSNG